MKKQTGGGKQTPEEKILQAEQMLQEADSEVDCRLDRMIRATTNEEKEDWEFLYNQSLRKQKAAIKLLKEAEKDLNSEE